MPETSPGEMHNTSSEPLSLDQWVDILSVDDNEALRYALVRCLRDAGYRVTEARTGAEALALAAKQPDLITLDINLPDSNGFDICRKLKSDPKTAHIPILQISSTFVDSDARVQGLASGADAYLSGPVDRAEVVATVAALLRLKTAERAAREHAVAAEAARHELARINETLERRVNERTAELQEANESLRELSGRLLRMQDEERRRIARNLHDGVGQLLAAIQMNYGTIRKEAGKLSPDSQKALEECHSLVDEIIQSTRTISHLLHPPLLDELGLRSALGWYVDEFSRRSGIQVELECDSSLGRMTPELETAIFRIVQESLGNVHRHSGSATAKIRLGAVDDTIDLEISDVGRGIPPAKIKDRHGVGLRGMKERVERFGGEFRISSDHRGTFIKVRLPFEAAANDGG